MEAVKPKQKRRHKVEKNRTPRTACPETTEKVEITVNENEAPPSCQEFDASCTSSDLPQSVEETKRPNELELHDEQSVQVDLQKNCKNAAISIPESLHAEHESILIGNTTQDETFHDDQTDLKSNVAILQSPQMLAVSFETGTLPVTCEDSKSTTKKEVGSKSQIPSCPELSMMPTIDLPFSASTIKSKQSIAPSKEGICIVPRIYPSLQEVTKEFESIKPFSEVQLLHLYSNSLLESNAVFIENFIQYEKNPDDNHFYELVRTYLRSRSNLASVQRENENFQKKMKQQAENLWELIPDIVSQTGRCLDGKTVSGYHKFTRARFNDDALSILSQTLQQLREHVQDSLVLHIYTAEFSNLQIESYIQTLLSSSSFKDIPRNASVGSYPSHERCSLLSNDILHLRLCISVLFSFHRIMVADKKFVMDIRDWLTKLVSVLLRVASFDDHLFILNHVLRCPAGIASWAVPFVQPPAPVPVRDVTEQLFTFGSVFLDHALVTLSTLLLPIKAREEFLEHFRAALGNSSPSPVQLSENLWVVVDSEGEEDEDPSTMWLLWQENDIVALLNQIPVSAIFKNILLIVNEEGTGSYSVEKTSEQRMLKIFAFSTYLVKLFYEGLKTYCAIRYKQLTKRLSRLIRHTVQYVSDHWQAFCQSHRKDKDSPFMLRLQVEYDQFFLRAVNYIFSSQRLGAWQFMAVLPYKCVSTQMMWRLLWVLHNSYQEKPEICSYHEKDWEIKLQSKTVKILFEEKLATLPESEAFYLLTAFANMASAREQSDIRFVSTIAIEVFEIAFVNKRLRETLSKDGRDLLASIAMKHSFIISVLLKKVKESIEQVGMVSLFLFRELPIHLWQPLQEDIDLLAEFLLTNSLASPSNQLARLVLSEMNWDFNSEGSQLFLGLEIHQQVALLVIECFRKFTNFADASMLSRSIQQVFLLAQTMRANAATTVTEQGFVTWAWDLLLCLRLHTLHGPKPPWVKILALEQDDNEEGEKLLDLHGDTKLHLLLQAVKQKQPAACYVALAMTSIGHSAKQICQEGFDLWSDLIAKEMYAGATHALFVLLPYFYRDPYPLISNERFLSNMQYIILADLTYISLAKSLVVSEFPGKALQLLAAVLLSQIKQSKMYAAEVGAQAARLWCVVLVKMLDMSQGKSYLAKWKGADYVLYLLDQLVQFAVTDSYLMETVLVALSRLVKSSPSTSGTTVVSSILSLVSSSFSHHWPSLAPQNALPYFPWYFWCALSVETDNHQMESLWKAVQLELCRDSSLTPDAAVKRVSATLKIAQPRTESLPLCRWGMQALETDIGHPCLPLLWQKFFTLYLQRIGNLTEGAKGSIGYRFFSGDCKIALLKRMKRRLNETADYHFRNLQECSTIIAQLEQEIEGLVDDNDEFVVKEKSELLKATKNKGQNHDNLMRLFRSFSCWIEEPRLHDADLRLNDVPAQYQPEKLKAVIEGDKIPWFEFIEMEKVHLELDKLMTVWIQQRKPTKSQLQLQKQDETSSEVRILKRLCTYDDPLSPPTISPLKQILPEMPKTISNSAELFLATIQNCLRTICSQARGFSQRSSNHLCLDCEYLELLPVLYRNDVTQMSVSLTCNRHLEEGKPCLGPAIVVLTFREAHKIETVKVDIERNRTAYGVLLSEFAQPPPQNVCSSAVFVEYCITELVKQSRNLESSSLREIGIQLFYHVVSLMDHHTNQYTPSRQFLTSCIDVLGEEFICGKEDQCLPLIKITISQPSLAGLVAPLFMPTSVSPEIYLELYEYLVSNLCPATANVVFVLLSKFDLSKWLAAQNPKLSICSSLLNAIGQALFCLGTEPEDDMVILLDVFKNHLMLMLMYEFPKYYGDVLHILLKGIEMQSINLKVWNDFLQVLNPSPRPQDPFSNLSQCKIWLSQYSTLQNLLSEKMLEESLQTVLQFFQQQRLNSKEVENFGLYHKFGLYSQPLGFFLGMMLHAWIFSKMHCGAAAPSELLCTNLWMKVHNSFIPLTEPWMNGERSMCPWTELDSAHASWIVFVYVWCLDYIHGFFSGLPSNCVLNLTWKNYVQVYAREYTKDHILTMCLNKFVLLPWETFLPDLSDVQLMVKALEKKKDECTAFVGNVFSRVLWDSTFQHISSTETVTTVSAYLVAFASLAFQLVWEPNVQASGNMLQVFHKAKQFSWFLLRPIEVQTIFDLAVQRCFGICLISHDADNSAEKCIFSLLQNISGMSPGSTSPSADLQEAMQKRLIYVSHYVQLVLSAGTLKQRLTSKYKTEFQAVLPQLMDLCEAVIVSDVPPANHLEAGVDLLCIVFKLMGQRSPTELQKLTSDVLLQWISTHTNSILTLPAITAACRSVTFVQHLVSIVEACIGACCIAGASASPYGGWSHIIPMLQIAEMRQEDFLLGCVEMSCHLTQTAFLLQQLPTCHSLVQELSFFHRAIDWFAKMKPSENAEPKAILLWDKVIDLGLRQADFGGDIKVVERALNGLGTTLMSFGEDKIYLGFLGVIGLGNSSPFSLRFRLMCRAFGTFVLMQLPVNGKLRLEPNGPGHIRSLSGGVGKPSQQTLQAVGKLEALRSSKQYLPLVQTADWAWEFVMDPNKCLRDWRALLQEFVSSFYSNKVYLRLLNAHEK